MITVKQLIEKLSTYPPDMPVACPEWDQDGCVDTWSDPELTIRKFKKYPSFTDTWWSAVDTDPAATTVLVIRS